MNVTNSFGTLTEHFGGAWNGMGFLAGEIDHIGVGTWEINVSAIFVPPAGAPIELDLWATKTSFGDGSLFAEIKVDPKVKDLEIEEQQSKPGGGALPAGDDDDDDEIDIVVPIIIGVGVASAIGIAGIAIYLLKRKR